MSAINLSKLAQELGPIIAPFLPYLLEGAKTIGKKVLEKLGEKFTEAGWEKAKRVWENIFPKGIEQEEVEKNLVEYAPLENDTRKYVLVSYELEKILKKIPKQEIQSINKIVNEMKSEINVARASGKGSVAIVGDVSGTTVTTGNTRGEPKDGKKKK